MHLINTTLLFILLLVSTVFGANTHGPGGTDIEMGRRDADTLPSYVTEGCLHSTSGTTTVTMTTCKAYVRDTLTTPILKYMEENATKTVVYNGGAGEYWLVVRWDLNATPAGFTCTTGNPYCWQRNATQPALPGGTAWLQHATVVGTAVTAVEDISTRIITGNQILATSMSIGTQASWTVQPGGKITLNAGVGITNGGCITPVPYQIFFGDNALDGVRYGVKGPCSTVYSEMWGGKGDGIGTANQTYFNAAFAALPIDSITGCGRRETEA